MNETMSRDHKLYRMMLTAYDDHGDSFWSFVQELVLINYWGEFEGEMPEKLIYEAIPEAQQLMLELLQRGLVYITRMSGWPPPTHDRFVVPDTEVGAIVADKQNWIVPLDDDFSAIYYYFCSTIPGASITEDNLHLLDSNVRQSTNLS